jgi:hypothetical protein
MVVVEIRISDELRKDLRAEIREAIRSSPLVRRLTSGITDTGKESEDVKGLAEIEDEKLIPRFWDRRLDHAKCIYQKIKRIND